MILMDGLLEVDGSDCSIGEEDSRSSLSRAKKMKYSWSYLSNCKHSILKKRCMQMVGNRQYTLVY